MEPFELDSNILWVEGWGEELSRIGDRFFKMTKKNKETLKIYNQRIKEHRIELEKLVEQLEKEE